MLLDFSQPAVAVHSATLCLSCGDEVMEEDRKRMTKKNRQDLGTRLVPVSFLVSYSLMDKPSLFLITDQVYKVPLDPVHIISHIRSPSCLQPS